MKENPLILSIETSGAVCGVALSAGPEIIAEYCQHGKNVHDRFLGKYIRRILLDTENTIGRLDCVAVSSGPGSFTGLRIGAAIAKGICYGNTPALISVPTLFAIAYSAADTARAMKSGGITATVHSHRKLFYARHFSLELEAMSEVMAIEYDKFEEIRQPENLICGTGLLPDCNGIAFARLNELSAKAIAMAAYALYSEIESDNKFIKPEDFEPLYFQEFIPKTAVKKFEIKR